MPEEIVTPPAAPELSFSDKFTGILSSPGEVYSTIVDTEPKSSNWAIPVILAIVMSIIFTLVVFNQPAIQNEMAVTQQDALQKQVDAGKLTQEQMDQALEYSKTGSPMFMIFGSVGAVIGIFVMVFAYSLVYWVGGKIVVKSAVGYMKVVEVYGLSMFIAVVTTLLSMILIVAMGSLHAQPALSLFVSKFNPKDTMHIILAAVNLFTFWQLFVVSVGLSKIWKTTLDKGLMVTGGVWVLWTLITAFAGLSFGG
ncbi:MAG: YIP1 family protein [Bacteroidetes bacterium]|nr:YIP1 family protein [Bacteroidota bacterium]